MQDDAALLKDFVRERRESALAALVRRHADLVYSAALRQTGGRNPALAEDVTQEVFILLATKAGGIRDGEALAGWLLITTRFAALNALRSEARRRRHENEAAAMKRDQAADVGDDDDPVWKSVAPVLDEAIGRLRREDRDALALRYFQGRSADEIALAMGVSPDAAQKRVWRAVEKLRDYFVRRGIETTPQGFARLLESNAVAAAAPAALVAKIASSAALASAASSASAVASGKGMVSIMAATVKTKIIMASAACVLLAGVTGTIAYQQLSGPRTRQVQVAAAGPTAASPSAATAPVLNYMAQLHQVYDLVPGENVKFVQPPFIADRLQYYRDIMKDGSNIASGPDTITFEFDGRKGFDLKWRRAIYAGGIGSTVGHALSSVAWIESFDTTISPSMLGRQLPGDWVYRTGATKAQLTDGLSQIFRKRLGMVGSLVQTPIERDAIVASGTYVFTPLPTTQPAAPGQRRKPTIHFFRGKSGPGGTNYGTLNGGDLEFLRHVAELTGLPAVNDAKFGRGVRIAWCDDESIFTNRPDVHDSAAEDEMLANITRQTGLRFSRERRVVPTWVWETPTTAP